MGIERFRVSADIKILFLSVMEPSWIGLKRVAMLADIVNEKEAIGDKNFGCSFYSSKKQALVALDLQRSTTNQTRARRLWEI